MVTNTRAVSEVPTTTNRSFGAGTRRVRGLLAWIIFIALGALFATTVLAGANGTVPYGISRLLAGIAFCLGLILVIVGGAELFTGNTLMVMAWAAGKVSLKEMLRAWAIIYVGNFIGAVTLSIPTSRFNLSHVDSVRQAAIDLTNALGGTYPQPD